MKSQSMQQAIASGTAYRIHVPGWVVPYWPIGAESPEEARDCYRELVNHAGFTDHSGTECKVDRVIGGRTGCLYVEDAGTITL